MYVQDGVRGKAGAGRIAAEETGSGRRRESGTGSGQSIEAMTSLPDFFPSISASIGRQLAGCLVPFRRQVIIPRQPERFSVTGTKTALKLFQTPAITSSWARLANIDIQLRIRMRMSPVPVILLIPRV